MLKIGKKVLEKAQGPRVHQNGGERQAHGEQEAERLVQEGAVAAGLTEEELAELPGSGRAK